MEQPLDGDLVTLLDEDGKEIVFDHLLTFKYEKKTYVALLPYDQADADEGEVTILETIEQPDGPIYQRIENEVLLNEVFDEFMELFEEKIAENDDLEDE